MIPIFYVSHIEYKERKKIFSLSNFFKSYQFRPSTDFIFIFCKLPQFLGKDCGVIFPLLPPLFEIQSFLSLDWLLLKTREPSLPWYLSHKWKKMRWIEDFPKCESECNRLACNFTFYINIYTSTKYS